MAKTRSQTHTITVKKEEEDHKDTQLLHRVRNTTGNSNKITKRKSSRSKNSRLADQQVKAEETTNDKPPLEASPSNSILVKTSHISQEKIRQLIRYVVNDKMTFSAAASKLKLRTSTVSYYYNLYNNDPEKKIPVPLNELKGSNVCTQEQITALIKCIVDDGMSIIEASASAGMNYVTGCVYYRKYLEDPNHNIPVQSIQKSKQEQINKLISYIVDDKMTMTAASAKAGISAGADSRYYRKYLDDPNHDIPVANPRGSCVPRITQDQVNRLISAIIDDKMTVVDAAKKANMTKKAGWKYYRKYKNDPNHCSPVVGLKPRVFFNAIPQDKIKQLIGYIVDDKMTVKAASRKAKMSYEIGKRYYRKYRNDPNSISTSLSISAITPVCTQEQIKEFISFIVDDKMTVKDASEKTSMNLETGEKYYQQYLNDLYRDIPTPSHIASNRRCTEEQISTLIRCVIDDKMTLKAASKKANMHYETGIKYFQEYVNDPNNNASMPNHLFSTRAHNPEKVNALISYIVNDKMSIKAASKKTGISCTVANNYYHRYINNLNDDAPTRKIKYTPCTQEQIDNVIRYITEDKMSVPKASRRANISTVTGRKYYQRYLKDHCHTIP